VFFFILIINSILNYFTKPTIIEGATGATGDKSPSNSEDPLILANKNTEDISILKQKIDDISKLIDPETTKASKLTENLAKDVSKNTDDIKKNSQTINSLMQSMSPTNNKASQQNQKIADEDPSTFNMPANTSSE
jgi:tetrahydromethanopterin S-methyltransferase subunit B